MIKFTESNNKTMAALTAGGQLTIETNRRWFDVIVNPMLGVVTLKSKERGKAWDDAELICKAEECLHLVDEALHDLECYDDEAPENEEDPLERFTRYVEKSSEPEDDYDHYRGYCPNCETILEDIAMWNKNGTQHHSVYYCPNCGAELPVEPPSHIDPII